MGVGPSSSIDVAVSDVMQLNSKREIRNMMQTIRFRMVSSQSETSDPLRWPEKFMPSFPAYVAHPRYGACLISARREFSQYFPGASPVHYLVKFVNPFRGLVKSPVDTRHFYEVPESMRLSPQLVYKFVRPMKRLITYVDYNRSTPSRTIIHVAVAPDMASSNGIDTAFPDETGEQLTLQEFREAMRNDDGTQGYRQAWAALMQQYSIAVSDLELDRLYTGGPSGTFDGTATYTRTASVASALRPASASPSRARFQQKISQFIRETTSDDDEVESEMDRFAPVAPAFEEEGERQPIGFSLIGPDIDKLNVVMNHGHEAYEEAPMSAFVKSASAISQGDYQGFPPWYKQLCSLPKSSREKVRQYWTTPAIGAQIDAARTQPPAARTQPPSNASRTPRKPLFRSADRAAMRKFVCATNASILDKV